MGCLQRRYGSHTLVYLVHRQGYRHIVYHHLVQVDIPRLRIDQLLSLEWKYLLPINLANLVLMVLIIVYGIHL